MEPDLAAVFPVEIFEEIIDQSVDGNESLCNLSLSCRKFLPRVRWHMFSSIHFGRREKIESALTFLQARSWLPPLVHCIAIQHSPSISPFMLHAVVPARLITMLPNLRRLEISKARLGHTLDIGAEDIRRTSRASISYNHSILSALRHSYTSIKLLELTEVTFRTDLDFQNLVCTFQNLKSLICKGISFDAHSGASGQPPEDSNRRVLEYKPSHLTRVVVSADVLRHM